MEANLSHTEPSQQEAARDRSTRSDARDSLDALVETERLARAYVMGCGR